MEIVELPVGGILPYDNNPRLNDSAIDKVAASIKEFGFKNPIIVDREYTIICGHTRLEAAKKLGMEFVPCIIALDLTPNQVKALRLADNKVAEASGWDFMKLDQELDKIGDSLEMKDFGFDKIDCEGLGALVDDGENFSDEKKEKDKEPVICPFCGEVVE